MKMTIRDTHSFLFSMSRNYGKGRFSLFFAIIEKNFFFYDYWKFMKMRHTIKYQNIGYHMQKWCENQNSKDKWSFGFEFCLLYCSYIGGYLSMRIRFFYRNWILTENKKFMYLNIKIYLNSRLKLFHLFKFKFLIKHYTYVCIVCI